MIVNVLIEGVTPLLQHRFGEQSEVQKNSRKVHIAESDPRTEAEKVAYRNADGELYFPGAAIARLLREAGGAHKQRGSRKTLKYVVPSAILVPEDAILLIDTNGTAISDFEVDSRPVTIPATKGRIMRHRPRLNAWRAAFSLEIDDSLIDAETVHQLLSEGGRGLGIGDFRPEKGGPFGRFRVLEWAEGKLKLVA